jgi:hypothetical protein
MYALTNVFVQSPPLASNTFEPVKHRAVLLEALNTFSAEQDIINGYLRESVDFRDGHNASLLSPENALQLMGRIPFSNHYKKASRVLKTKGTARRLLECILADYQANQSLSGSLDSSLLYES